MGAIKGYSDLPGEVEIPRHGTLNPVQYKRAAPDIIAHGAVEVVTSSETVVIATASTITSTGSNGRVGDAIRLTSGTLSGALFSIVAVSGTTYSINSVFSSVPSGGATFEILRYRHPVVDSSGNLGVTLASAARVKIWDGTDEATIASAIDSRNGIDIQHSSIASKNLVSFTSSNGAMRLLAGAERIISPDNTRAGYWDLQGYGNLLINFTDNSSGASGGVLYMRWSDDGVNTAYNDPGDGTGGSNFTTGVNSAVDGLVVAGRLLPLGGRYLNMVYVQGATNQGTTYPNVCNFTVSAIPIGFTNQVTVTNTVLPVVGPADVLTYGYQPVIVGGVDNVSSPTTAIPLLLGADGKLTVFAVGNVAHDSPDGSTGPVKIGGKGYSSAPTAVTANDRVNAYFDQQGRLCIFSDQSLISVGNVAAGSSDSGNPVKVGGVAKTAIPTARSDGQRVDFIADDVGRQVVCPHQLRDLCSDQHTIITSTTAATTVVTADASHMLDLTDLILTNLSSTGSEVQLLDDDGTTIRASWYVPANDSRGMVFATPFKQTAVNKTWKVKTVTSIASLRVTAKFFKNGA